MARADLRIAQLIDLLEAMFGGRSWNGPSLRSSLRGLTPKQAQWRPAPGRNAIWELVLHCAYWKHEVRRRLSGGKAEEWGRAPGNFPALPARKTTAAWRSDIALLEREHQLLVRTVRALEPADLKRRGRNGWRNEEQIYGVAAHDAYHTGQIQLIRRLMR